MADAEKSERRAKLSKSISDKLDLNSKLRTDLEMRKKSIGNSVDEQIVIAEMEYRLVKEEMALLTLQEQHWEAAALWDADTPQTPDIQKEVCEVLHSYIMSVKETGSIPVLHASEHLTPENSILISSQGDKPSIPKVEWAHHSTDLQIGDRLLEVNGRLLIGKESCEVNRILSRPPVSRIVFLRPISLYQMLKSNGCKETSNLRHELTSVVTRLNHKMAENAMLVEQNVKLQSDCDSLRMRNRKLKLQFLSLQSVLLYLHQALEKSGTLLLPSEFPSVFETLSKISADDNILCSNAHEDAVGARKSIPWLELGPKSSDHGHECPDVVMQETADDT